MKKIFTLISTTLLSVSLFAFAPKTQLTVSTNSKKAVTIVVDGRTYNDRQNDDDIVIKNLATGSHNIKVYEKTNNSWMNISKKSQLLYEGNVYMKPQYHTTLSISRSGRAMISEKPMTYWDYPTSDKNGGYNYQYPQVMNERGFDKFRYTVNQTTFENSKLGVAKEVISQNYFTAEQVKTLLSSFSYESSKLDIAKYAYERTVDQENYFTVLNGLTYSASKDELTRFMQRAR